MSKNVKKQKLLKIEREDIITAIFDGYSEHLQNDAKDIILDGFKFKGLNNMSDKELKGEYKNILYIDDKIKIIDTEED